MWAMVCVWTAQCIIKQEVRCAWLCVLNQIPPTSKAAKPQVRGRACPLHRGGKTLGPASQSAFAEVLEDKGLLQVEPCKCHSLKNNNKKAQ